MPQTESAFRPWWLLFSALMLALCGWLLLGQLRGHAASGTPERLQPLRPPPSGPVFRLRAAPPAAHKPIDSPTDDRGLPVPPPPSRHHDPSFTKEHIKGAPNPGKAEQEAVAPAAAPAAAPAYTARDDLDKLVPGWFAVTAPSEMTVGESARVRVLIQHDQLKALEIEELIHAVEGRKPRVHSQPLAIGRQLRVELKPDSMGDFEVQPFMPAEQPTHNDQAAAWEWAVTPRLEGEKNLSVVVTNLADKDGQPIDIKIQTVRVHIKVMPMQKFKELALTISGVMSGVAGALGAWLGLIRPLLQRRREEGSAEDGTHQQTERAGGAGADPPEGGKQTAGGGAATSHDPSSSGRRRRRRK